MSRALKRLNDNFIKYEKLYRVTVPIKTVIKLKYFIVAEHHRTMNNSSKAQEKRFIKL